MQMVFMEEQFMLTSSNLINMKPASRQISYIATAIYAPTALFVKVSLITILIRVFQPYYRAMILLYALLGVVIGYYTIITFIKIFICDPISAYWLSEEQENAKCFDQPSVIIADSVISFVTDVAIFAFPVAFTWTLQMPFWKKVKVMVLLGFGGIAIAFSLWRLVIGIRERSHPDSTTMFMTSILTANAELDSSKNAISEGIFQSASQKRQNNEPHLRWTNFDICTWSESIRAKSIE
ncbi:hypothetical protein N7493_003348 [Penicillium malachiteum]|uniref:Rhodopsin domain-containing protein n=1 Tax=Penicillium malachiteum TaxID=1324776 RepID=A0AAD6HPG9_9EURO|nr:hypothetical protein N7493_003348 [Penicillium malachiteum]